MKIFITRRVADSFEIVIASICNYTMSSGPDEKKHVKKELEKVKKNRSQHGND